ncbi:MAG: aminotransferase class I/II-fold pyridoxal phosphate-dependent enzyme, partial [Clostridia bacterium]|nr:aminotransferase class I/II-fold pyridoxal phosphate-dependent enzyme [Clostridia bacterium]
MLLNENITLLPESGISVKKRVEEYLAENPSRTLLYLNQSLMNMSLPEEVIEGMKNAVEETAVPFGTRLSSPWSGYESLKQAVCRHLEKFNVKIPEGDVYITSGLESAYACLSHLFSAENNVLLTSPCHGHLQELCQCAGRNVSFLRSAPENGFAPEPDDTPSDLIYLASPDPVTGAVLTREKLQKWVSFANANQAIIFYDASLSEYIESEEYPHSIYEIEGAKDCAIQVFSFEKGYGVKELKIAYVVIPSGLIRENVRIGDLFAARQPSTATPPSFVMQKAAEILLS